MENIEILALHEILQMSFVRSQKWQTYLSQITTNTIYFVKKTELRNNNHVLYKLWIMCENKQ